MRPVVIMLFILSSAGGTALAGDNAKAAPTEAPTREALLKAAVARDRGDVTAMEPASREGQGVIIGHSSGAVLNCYGNHICSEFLGTPNAAVEHIAVSLQDSAEVIWVSYPQGAIYRCINNRCEKFLWDGEQGH